MDLDDITCTRCDGTGREKIKCDTFTPQACAGCEHFPVCENGVYLGDCLCCGGKGYLTETELADQIADNRRAETKESL